MPGNVDQDVHPGTRPLVGEGIEGGGRVLGVTALGDTLEAARANAYAAVEKIRFPGMFFRRDIGAKAVPAT